MRNLLFVFLVLHHPCAGYLVSPLQHLRFPSERNVRLAAHPSRTPGNNSTRIVGSGALRELIRIGERWKRGLNLHQKDVLQIQKEQHRVPYCAAATFVVCDIGVCSERFILRGTSESRIVEGLLGLIGRGIKDLHPASFLNITTADLYERSNTTIALPLAKLAGFRAIVESLKQQIHGHLLTSSWESQLVLDMSLELPADTMNKPKVAVLLSGGVDSSVALALLLNTNSFRCEAFHFQILDDELQRAAPDCPWQDDMQECQRVCDHLGVRLHIVPFRDAYKEFVVRPLIEGVKHGRTPNPDVLCNSALKFGAFFAMYGGQFDFMATGHYAKLQKTGEPDTLSTRLFRSPSNKDQSYFLSRLTRQQLGSALFPVGSMDKSEVRSVAMAMGLSNADRPDSQGLCFLGRLKFNDFLSLYIPPEPGPIYDCAVWNRPSTEIGSHNGLWRYTVGQRRGIGSHIRPSFLSKGPYYVVAKDQLNNALYVSNSPSTVFTSRNQQILVDDVKWLDGIVPYGKVTLDVQVRHPLCVFKESAVVFENCRSSCIVYLSGTENGLCPGQVVAFYKRNECLGSGLISDEQWTMP